MSEEITIEGRRAFIQDVEGGLGFIICDRNSADCYSPPPYGWAAKSSGVWNKREDALAYARKCADKGG